ncbi:MAG: hypothetical protein V3U78_05420 [Thiotrichaceae bacterium]
MRANRIDSNQTEIVAHFREWGCSVLNISSLKNCADIIVALHGRSIVVEIKDGSKPKSARKLTSGEESFKQSWKGCWRLVESIKDADKVIAELTSPETIYTR